MGDMFINDVPAIDYLEQHKEEIMTNHFMEEEMKKKADHQTICGQNLKFGSLPTNDEKKLVVSNQDIFLDEIFNRKICKDNMVRRSALFEIEKSSSIVAMMSFFPVIIVLF